jgi:hypothetical protein
MRRLHFRWAVLTALGGANWASAEPAAPADSRECLPAVVIPYCPPGTTRPGVTPILPPIDPTRPIDPANPAVPPPATDPLARAPEGGTLAANTFNPNMFGDSFGGQSLGATRTRNLSFLLQGITPTGSLAASFPNIPYFGVANQGSTTVAPQTPGSIVILSDNGRTTSFAAPIFAAVSPITQGQNPVPLLENGTVSGAVRGLNPGAVVVFRPDGSAALLTGTARNFQFYDIAQNYDVTTGLVSGLFVPLPAGGGVVGRTKIADDNNPIPRDRIIFNADYYNNTALTPNGFDVYRFSPGFEKTFCDQRASVEFRFPFASTVDPAVMTDGLTNRNVEFGNVNVTLKGLLFRSNEFALSAGAGFSLPTGPDTRVRATDGTEVLRVENQSYIITPFLAGLYIPNERWFAQAWVQVGFDPTGCPVQFATASGETVTAGRLHDQTLLQTDVQLGFWLMRDPSAAGLRGLAPFVELHYNTPISDASVVHASGLTIGSLDNRFDELNLTAGVSAVIGEGFLLSAGLVVPLRSTPDRFFDYQFGLRANWLLGPTGSAAPLTNVAGGGMSPGGMGEAPAVDPLARAPETGTLAQGTFNPNFFGDDLGSSRNQTVTSIVNGIPVVRTFRVPLMPRYGGMKTSDHDGPRPMDRVFFSWNGYSGVNESVNPPGTPSIRLSREIIGMETTLGSDASLGFRLPFIQTSGGPSFDAQEVGDLTLVGKYAVINDQRTGNLLTLGLTVTLPTGGRGGNLGVLDDGSTAPRALFVQPWVGGVLNYGDLFVQGISAAVLPAEPVYPTVLFNSVGVGYWVYRNRNDALLQGIVPVAELHVNTPLTNRRDDATIFLRDQVNLTTGLYMQFPRLTVGGALCVPLAGPRPYELEAMLSVNYQF